MFVNIMVQGRPHWINTDHIIRFYHYQSEGGVASGTKLYLSDGEVIVALTTDAADLAAEILVGPADPAAT